jgi:uncharacterized protein
MKLPKHSPSFLVLWLSLAIALPATAQEQPAARAATHLPLWKLEGKTNSVYLLGSVHFLNKTNYPLAAPIEAAFKEAQVVAFETDVGAMSQADTQLKLLNQAKLPEGETLKDQLSAETYAAFMQSAEKSGLPEAMFTQFKPLMAATMLLLVDLLQMGLDPEQGVDQHYFRRARASGKEIVPLETVDYQIDLVTGLSKEEGELAVKSMLKDMANTRKMLGEIVKAWRTGDAASIDKFLNEATSEAPAIMKRMVTDRNRNWTPKIEGLLHGGKNAVVIVGAAHLVGKEGVVELLRQRGMKVTQL